MKTNKTTKTSSLIRREPDLELWIKRLKEGEERAWEGLMLFLKGSRKHIKTVTFQNYGREEMKAMYLDEDEIDAIMNQALFEAIMKYEPGIHPASRQDERRRLMNYCNLYMGSAVKRAIEKANGVSKYFAGNLLWLKKRGVDLWDSPEEEIISCLEGIAPCRNGKASAEMIMLSMRDYFGRVIAGRTTLDDIPDEPDDGGIEDADMKMTLEMLYERLGSEQLVSIFKRYFLENETNIRTLAREHKASSFYMRRTIDVIREVAQEVFASYMPGYSIPNADKSHAAQSSDVIELEDLFELF